MTPLYREALEVTRQTGHYEAGTWTVDSTESISISATMAPTISLDPDPRGARARGAAALFCGADVPELVTADVAGERQADRLVYGSRTYMVQAVQLYGPTGLRAYTLVEEGQDYA
jgi:hypothetical protein